MNKKRNLLEELNMREQNDIQAPFGIDVGKIKDMVNNSIDSAYSERNSGVMKSKKKISLIAIAATLILGVTVFAASGIITNWYSSSSSISDYKSLPTKEQVAEDIGYEAVIIEAFENGYTFKSGSVVDNSLTDENKNSVEKFKSVSFTYEKDGDQVTLSQDKFNSDIESYGDIIASVDGVDVYYYSYTNKLVPPDYEMTDEDRKAEKNGELVFSYGSDKVEIIEVQNAAWTEDGVRYSLIQMDGRLAAEELTDMAKEIIEK